MPAVRVKAYTKKIKGKIIHVKGHLAHIKKSKSSKRK